MKVIIELEFEQEHVNQQDVENYLTELIDDGSLDWYWYPNGLERTAQRYNNGVILVSGEIK